MARSAPRLRRVGLWCLPTLLLMVFVMRSSLAQTTSSHALSPATPDMPALVSAQVKRLGILPPLQDEHTTDILQRLSDERFIFEAVNISLPAEDTLDSYAEALSELRSGHIAALVGPYHSQFSVACRHLRLSYLVTSQLPKGVEPDPFLNELFPSADVFARSVSDIISFYRYTKVAVLYDTWAGAVVLEHLLLQPAMEVTAFRVQPSDLQQVRGALKTMRDQYLEVYLTVLSPSLTNYLMDEALTLSMFSPKYKWILINTHLDEFALDRYVDTRANVTVLRLMMDFNSEKCMLKFREITLKRAVLQDAVQVYKLQTANRLGVVRVSMRETNRQVDLAGCTGHLNFTKMGRRVESFLQIMSLQGYRKGEVTDEEIGLILGASKLRKVKGQMRERETLRRQLVCIQRCSSSSAVFPVPLPHIPLCCVTGSRLATLLLCVCVPVLS